MQRNTRACLSDVGSDADDAGDVEGEALHGVPVCRDVSELWAVVAEVAEVAVVAEVAEVAVVADVVVAVAVAPVAEGRQ